MSEPTPAPGATPSPGTPATGIPASVGATPTTKPATLEEALAKIAELEHATLNATEERDRQRKKLTAYEKAEADAKAAQLSEVEKAAQRATDAEQRVKTYQQQLAVSHVKLAAHSLGIIDPDIAALAIQSKLEYDDDGMPTNVEKLLADLVKSKPYLVAKPADPAPSPTQHPAPGAPAIPAMNPGRTNIVQPGANPQPGKIPTLGEVYRSNRNR